MKKTVLLFLITFAAIACQNEVTNAFIEINNDLEKTIAKEEKAIDSLQALQEPNRMQMLEMRFMRENLKAYSDEKQAIITQLKNDYENLEAEINSDSELFANRSLAELNKKASKIIEITNRKSSEKENLKSLDIKDIEGFPVIAVIAELNAQHQALLKEIHRTFVVNE